MDRARMTIYAYLHLGGCDKPAFLYDHMPAHGERISSKHARHLDGKQIKPYEDRTCDSCGKQLRHTFLTTKALTSWKPREQPHG